MKRNLHLILLGATVDAYALATAFYEDYGVSATVMDEQMPSLFSHSRAAVAYPVPHLKDGRILLRALSDVYERNDGRRLMLLPMTAAYAALVSAAEQTLAQMFLLPGAFLTPAVFCDDAPRPYPAAVLFCYVGREGERRLTYAAVAGYDKNGAPAALITEHTPHDLAQLLLSVEGLPRGFFLLCVYVEGDECVLTPAASYPSLLRFPLAADHSLPEYLLNEYLLFRPLPAQEEIPVGLYRTLPLWRIRFCRGAKKEARRLRRRRLSVSLYNARTERFSLLSRVAFRRLCRMESREET